MVLLAKRELGGLPKERVSKKTSYRYRKATKGTLGRRSGHNRVDSSPDGTASTNNREHLVLLRVAAVKATGETAYSDTTEDF